MIAIVGDILVDTDKATHVWNLARYSSYQHELYRSSKGNYYTLLDSRIGDCPNIKLKKLTKHEAALVLHRVKLLTNPEIEIPEELIGLCEVE